MPSDWNLRPVDFRNLLNPAFCGVLLAESIKEYNDTAQAGMPLPLAFLVLPVVTTTSIRSNLPSYSTTSLPGWLHENSQVRIDLAGKTRSLLSLTRESLLFCLQHQAVRIDAEQQFHKVARKISSTEALEKRSTNVSLMLEKARFLGRWLARSGSPATIYFLLGLRP